MAKKSKVQKSIESEQREKRKEQGFFDGRFIEKIVPDKKKKYKRNKTKKVQNPDEI